MPWVEFGYPLRLSTRLALESYHPVCSHCRGILYDFEYTNKEVEVKDGMIDQVGGEKGRGYCKKRFITLLESLDTPLQDQGKKIYAELLGYQGKEKRRDDVSIIGFKL